MWNKDRTEELVRLLYEAYPDPDCALKFRNRFELLIAVMLSAQTTDKQVNKVTPELFASFPDPATLGAASAEAVEELIRRIGMYKTKARNIIAASQLLESRYQGQVPSEFEELLSLPGVGRKTANVVRAVGFGIPAIPVDTHVFRLSGRLGIARGKDVNETEELLMKALPEEVWIDMHHALIWHGRNVCSARKPDCQACTVSGLCEYFAESQK